VGGDDAPGEVTTLSSVSSSGLVRRGPSTKITGNVAAGSRGVGQRANDGRGGAS